MSAADTQSRLLDERLAGATSVQEAADLVVDHLLDLGFSLPSIYLERGGRLRSVAHRGYWQVYDGLPAGAGVLGSTFASGEPSVLRRADEHPEYIRAVPGVVAEMCLPLHHDAQVCGVLNVEAFEPLSDHDVATVTRLGRAFERRLAALGGPPGEDPAELLARLGYELACLDEPDRIITHTLAAAQQISGMTSGGLFVSEPGGLTLAASTGPLAGLFESLPEQTVDQLAGYVSRATSSYAAGDEPGEGFEATHLLRSRGVTSMAVLALVARGHRQGVMVLADEQPRPSIGAAIPRLELLAAISAAVIESAGVSVALQESRSQLAFQATHDVLTGVANRARLLEVVEAQLPAPAPGLAPVVLFVDLDGFKAVNDQHGHAAGDRILAAVAERLTGAARSTDLVARLGGDEFVVVCGQLVTLAEATTVAERVLERLAQPFHFDGVDARITACVGIAAAGAHRSAEALIAAADRAMYAAKARGPGHWALADG